jgi:OOP family OmpA-OmpF porin
MDAKMQNKGWIAAASALALMACGDRTPEEKPVVDPAAEDASQPQSIIRPDVEQVVVAETLAPLVTRVSFAEGGSELSEQALADLATVRESPQVAEGGPIILRGHSDAGGSDSANIRASEARAQAVADWLIEMGVAEERITTIGFGEQNPVEPNALPDGSPNEQGRAANRRVDITVELPSPAPKETGAAANDAKPQD